MWILSGSVQRQGEEGSSGHHLGLRAAMRGILFSETVPASSKRTMPMRLVHGAYSSTCRQRDWDQSSSDLEQRMSFTTPQDSSQRSTGSLAKDGCGCLTFNSWHVVSTVHITALALSMISALTSALRAVSLRRGAKIIQRMSVQNNELRQDLTLLDRCGRRCAQQ